MLMCPIFPAPLRLAMAKAAVASAYTMPALSTPKSFNRLLIPISSVEHFTNATNSASADERVTWFWVLAHPLMK